MIPSLDCRPRLLEALEVDEIILDRERWALLVAIDGRRSVRELVQHAARPVIDVCHTLLELVEAGAVGVLDPVAAPAPTPRRSPAADPGPGSRRSRRAGPARARPLAAPRAGPARATPPPPAPAPAPPAPCAGPRRPAAGACAQRTPGRIGRAAEARGNEARGRRRSPRANPPRPPPATKAERCPTRAPSCGCSRACGTAEPTDGPRVRNSCRERVIFSFS